MNSDIGVIDGNDDLPTIRDFRRTCYQFVYDCLRVIFLILQIALQVLTTLSTVLQSIRDMKNLLTVQIAKKIYLITVIKLGLQNIIFLSDVYRVVKFINRFIQSILVSYYVLSLKDTYVWSYFLEKQIVPLISLSVPLQVCINRQLLGPPFAKQRNVVTILWVCIALLIYFIIISIFKVHLHRINYEHVEGNDHETRVVLNNMDYIHLIALFEVPYNLLLASWKAVTLNPKDINYSHTVKNTLVLSAWNQCVSPLIGFVVCCRSRSGYVYPILYLQKLIAWGNSAVSLAVYSTYESMVASNFHVLTEAEVAELSDDDVCPVCLMEHNTDSCRLACNHLAHSACLISMLQNGSARKCPMCRMDISFNDSSETVSEQSTHQTSPIRLQRREMEGTWLHRTNLNGTAASQHGLRLRPISIHSDTLHQPPNSQNQSSRMAHHLSHDLGGSTQRIKINIRRSITSVRSTEQNQNQEEVEEEEDLGTIIFVSSGTPHTSYSMDALGIGTVGSSTGENGNPSVIDNIDTANNTVSASEGDQENIQNCTDNETQTVLEKRKMRSECITERDHANSECVTDGTPEEGASKVEKSPVRKSKRRKSNTNSKL